MEDAVGKKMVVLTATRAIQVEPVVMESAGYPNGRYVISLRQMYCTQKDKTWRPAKQGIVLDLDDDVAQRVAREILALAENPNTQFAVLNLREGN